MLAELKFVQGAVAKKDLVPALTHFLIEDGKVRGYNGTLALCAPIALDISCKPKAGPLIQAISKCEDTVSLTITPAGRLSIKSGGFRALVECVEGDTPHVLPEGDYVEVDGAVLFEALKAVSPFIGDDASRPWSNGVLLRDQSAFATNNVTLVEYWVGAAFPHVVNIPRAAIKEILRVNEAPVSVQMTDNSITFHFSNDRWLRTQLLTTEWPDLRKVLDRPSNPAPLNDKLFEALEKLKPFVDKMGRIYFGSGTVSTHAEAEEGASYEVNGLHNEGIYNIEMLQLLPQAAKTIDWALYPSACMFFGDRLRGAIIGMKL